MLHYEGIYYGVLSLHMPGGVSLMGYTDGLDVVEVKRTKEDFAGLVELAI